MAEWHITPDYIINNWTDELLNLMIAKLEERKKRLPNSSGVTKGTPDNLFSQSNDFIKVARNN